MQFSGYIAACIFVTYNWVCFPPAGSWFLPCGLEEMVKSPPSHGAFNLIVFAVIIMITKEPLVKQPLVKREDT